MILNVSDYYSSSHTHSFLFYSFIQQNRACLHAKLFQSCPILCNPMDCSPPGSSVHGWLSKSVPAGGEEDPDPLGGPHLAPPPLVSSLWQFLTARLRDKCINQQREWMSEGLSECTNSAIDCRVRLVGVGLAPSFRQERRPHLSVTKASPEAGSPETLAGDVSRHWDKSARRDNLRLRELRPRASWGLDAVHHGKEQGPPPHWGLGAVHHGKEQGPLPTGVWAQCTMGRSRGPSPLGSGRSAPWEGTETPPHWRPVPGSSSGRLMRGVKMQGEEGPGFA